MARLTIEECWWTDPRREKLGRLIGNLDVADITAVKAWRAAQTYWGKQQGWVPDYVFNALEHSPALIEAGLAVVGEGFVYVRGSKEHLNWVYEHRESAKVNGRKGGLKSAQRPRNEKGQLLSSEAISQAPAKQNPSESKPSVSVLGSDLEIQEEGEEKASSFGTLEKNKYFKRLSLETKKALVEKYGKEFIATELIEITAFLDNAGWKYHNQLDSFFARSLKRSKGYSDNQKPKKPVGGMVEVL